MIPIRKYWLDLLTNAWNESLSRVWGSAKDRIISAILTLLVTALLVWQFHGLGDVVERVGQVLAPVMAASVVFLAIFIFNWFRAPYQLAQKSKKEMLRLENELKERIEALKSGNIVLRTRLEPKLNILFSKTPAFHQTSELGDLFRVQIKNIGGDTIKKVKAMLKDIQPWEHGYPDIPLRQWDDVSEKWEIEFELNPQLSQFVDVVYKEAAKDAPIQLCYASYRASATIPAGNYTITLLATGENVQPHCRKFRVSVNQISGRLEFEPESESF